MSRRISFAEGEYYHLYNRGTEKRNIFSTNKDRERFLALLYLSNSAKSIHLSDHPNASFPDLLAIERGDTLVDLCAYCLMPNHVHLLVRERSDGGIAKFMQKLMTGYTMYFNMRHERTGALFQGKFKAQHAKDDRYLKYLLSYVHLNPVKLIEPMWKERGIKQRTKAHKYLNSYEYSSFLDYAADLKRPHEKILATKALPQYFDTPDTFAKSVASWLDFDARG